MLGKLILIFTLVPLTELALLIEVGRRIGTIPTVALVLATGVAGAILARFEGWRTVMAVKERLRAGSLPADELLQGALVFVGGLLLLTPGLLTDGLGFLLLLPPTRTSAARRLKAAIRRWIERGGAR